VQGADGAAVAGVAAGTTNADLVSAGTVGAGIHGAFGTLTLNADGSYSYQRDAGAAGGGSDVFTYTLRDGDGDTSHTTLTIALGDSSPGNVSIPTPGGPTTTVFEAGLPARGSESPGSDAASNSETTAGSITFTSPDGVGTVSLGGHVLTGTPQTFTDATGSLTASMSFNATTGTGTINYSYTLLDNTSGDTTSATYAVSITDTDGDTSPAGNLVINIVDDVPTAHADTDSVAAGQTTAETGNVITGVGTTSGATGADVQGADGAHVVGVAIFDPDADGTGTDLVDATTVGAGVHGSVGTLTLNADGSYSYQRDAGSPGGVSDYFIYTLRDGDGDLTHATLTIAIGDSTPTITIPAPGGPTTTVYEAGLGARGLEPAGSHSGDPADPVTTAGTIAINSPDGVQTVSLDNHVLTTSPQTFADGTLGSLTASYSFNAATGVGSINYSYTLLDNRIAPGFTSSRVFQVAVTDNDNESTPGNSLVIYISNDVPIANADTDSVAAGQFTPELGNVITGIGTTSGAAGADKVGADGAVVVGVVHGFDGTEPQDPGTVGMGVHGLFGTLTMQADGSYSYVRDAGFPGGGSDLFTYVLRDGDGDLAYALLTIAIGNSTPTITIPSEGGATTTVYEAGLGARGLEPAGSHTGDPADPVTTSGTIMFTSPDGVGTVSLGGHVLTTSPQTFADATGSLTASLSFNAATGAGTINYSYTLLNNTSGDNTTATFAVSITDTDGDSTPAGNLVIKIVDDVPMAHNNTDTFLALPGGMETGNVMTGVGTTLGAAGADVQGADGAHVVVDPETGTLSLTANHGYLTVLADGSYTYVRRDAGFGGGGSDVFTYQIIDGDGDISSATLTIAINNYSFTAGSVSIPTPGGPTTTVYEAGLPARGSESPGSGAGSGSNTTSGTITFTSIDGESGGSAVVSLGGHVLTTTPQTFMDATGSLTAYWTQVGAASYVINYSYTLLDNTSGDNTSVSFAVSITDEDGSSISPGNLVITIVDDVPTAHNDAESMGAFQTTAATGNVITGLGSNLSGSADVLGADGAVVAGVAVGNTNAALVSAGTVSTGIVGMFGILTLNADGSYTYARTVLGTSGGTDVFTYTLRDSDGDTSHATLTINILAFPSAPMGFEAPSSAQGSETADSQHLPSGVDHLHDSSGSDVIVVSSSAHLNAGDTIHGQADASTTNTLRLDVAGTYHLPTLDIAHIDSVVLHNDAAGFNIEVGNGMVSTADFNKDGVGGDLHISSDISMSNGVTIDASSLTGSNHIVVDGAKLDGNDVIHGGAGDDIIAGGKGSDTLTGGAGANHFQYLSTSDGGTIANQSGADHIVDFNAAKGDVIDILGAAFGNLAPGTNVAAIFGSSANDSFGSTSERFHYDTTTHTLLYDSNGSAAGGVQAALAVFDNHAIVAATNIHVV
jgi:VCBS repeat-containing protein